MLNLCVTLMLFAYSGCDCKQTGVTGLALTTRA